MQIKKLLFISLTIFVACILCGCKNNNIYLGRSDATGMGVIEPLNGILASAATPPNTIWATPDTNKTVDVVFSDNQSSNLPTYRYFQYAQGVNVPAYRVGEGVNIAIDNTYHGINTLSGDKNPLPMLVPITKISFRSYDKNRWSANPEAYTLGQDYLQSAVFGPLFNMEGQKPPPSVIFVLYEPSVYWRQSNAAERNYDAAPMYFDVYYSIDYWNKLNDDKIQAPDITDNDIKDLTPPQEFGVCKYSEQPASTLSSISVPSSGTATSLPKILVPDFFGGCHEEDFPTTNPTANGDITFTLLGAIGKTGADDSVTQAKVNSWTKYEFREMLLNNPRTLFNIAKQDKLYLPAKDAKESGQFALENNLKIPTELYSQDAYNTSMATTCPDKESRALEISKYSVRFTANDAYYHNRTLISNKAIYERSDARQSGLNWFWCWFSPQ